jgi:hypothetical protein
VCVPERAPRVATASLASVIHNPRPDGPPFRDVVDQAAARGVERVLYHVFDGDRDRMLRGLDRAATAVA